MSTKGTQMLVAWLDQPGRDLTGLARDIGVSITSVRNWRDGKRPKIAQWAKLEKACGIPVTAWLEAQP